MEELTSHVHLLIHVPEMEEVWLLELAYLFKIQNLFNSTQQVSTVQVVLWLRDAEVKEVFLETVMVRDLWKGMHQVQKI